MLRRSALTLAVAAALALPATATADDQSIYNAFHSSHPRFKQLRQEFKDGERHWASSNFKDPVRAYRACRRTVSLAAKVSDRIRPKTSSSAAGEEARDNVMRALNHRRKWADAERSAIEAFMRFDGDAYNRRRENARKYIARAQRYEERAQRLFEQAGVNPSP